jgi:hypothetical protein
MIVKKLAIFYSNKTQYLNQETTQSKIKKLKINNFNAYVI